MADLPELEWGDPPPDRGTGAVPDGTWEALKARPGEWARIRTDLSLHAARSYTTNVNKGKVHGGFGFEAVFRPADDDDSYDVYARWVGKPDPHDAVLAPAERQALVHVVERAEAGKPTYSVSKKATRDSQITGAYATVLRRAGLVTARRTDHGSLIEPTEAGIGRAHHIRQGADG